MGRSFENRKNAIFKTAAQKSKLYSKYGKKLYVIAKNGVPDPDGNPALRSLIEKAKQDQVPSHVIEKAIDRARGAASDDFVLARYEGFGPGGSLVIADCLTDNNQRTISEVRSCFTKTGSKLGQSGSVAISFDQLAVLAFQGDNEEEILEVMMEADVNIEEIESKDGRLTIFAPPEEFFKAKTALLEAFPETELLVQEITFFPQQSKPLEEEDLAMFQKFINMLYDCDDVQDVYHNVELPSE
ncbi:YebC/PmpR family DNA-binding transcriptional regulator [Lignipirellula cremea]|uniref:Probable transcriptional regulatory protein Pla8534_37740 n=1 Tax=Lignipirellula cremea TaxID=2528010 RepID=A0A518DVU1_9BACT|nr:YebC/PmpR family DNA-binding transcriptional regulator [Lignipirellula cremea]QDU95955.1 putative transcriptional regulatory protein YeeN [Lignipirellula cremea]